MEFPKSLKSALEKAEAAASHATNVSSSIGIRLGLLGDATISKTNGEVKTHTNYRAEKCSNHTKLDIHNRIALLQTALNNVMDELVLIFPDHDIDYKLDPTKQKHSLKLNNRLVIYSVLSSWKQQFPLVYRVFLDNAPTRLWILDTNFHPDRYVYGSSDIVPAPTLALAHLRTEFSSAPVKNRRAKTFKMNKIRVAAEVLPADTIETQTTQAVDKSVVEAAWNELQSSISGITTHSSCIISVSVNIAPDTPPTKDVNIQIHPLMDTEEQAKCYRASETLIKHIDRFIGIVSLTAPQASYTLKVDTFAGKTPPAIFYIGRTSSKKAVDVADQINKAQISGHGSIKTYLIQKEALVYLIRARSTKEAIANLPVRDYGLKEQEPDAIYIARPVCDADINEAMDVAYKEWENRLKA
jgi:hypothetical protein